ncbi:hypothetical protein KJ918_00250, partial [Patescibacteria group bacterium]|nr:hypothetical protein [Patescibacteria group bacterium]
PLGYGGTGASLSDPNADRILFWDDSAGASTWLTLGSNLSLTDTTLNADILTYYWGGSGAPTTKTNYKRWYGKISTSAGTVTLYPTTTGDAAGDAIFTNVYTIQCTPAYDTATVADMPLCSVKSFTSNKTLIINVTESATVILGGEGLAAGSHPISVYVTIIGD